MLDALIAGGGPAGAAAAIVLARAGHAVLLVDATPPDPGRLRVGESLPPASRPLLRDLGLLERLEGEGHLVSAGTSSAWGSPQPLATDFVFDPNGPGWHLDRPRFDRSLRRAAAEAGAEVREAVAVRGVRREGGAWRCGLDDGGEVTSRTLVDATGRRAALARGLGATRERRDRLVGLVGAAPARDGDLDARTLVEAVPDGWWYTALVPGRRRVVALMTDADLVPADARAAAGFAAALAETAHVGPLVGAAVVPLTEPAHGSRLRPPAGGSGGGGWLAVGDAAIAFDPLSSQGIATALYTGLVGAEALDAALAGDPRALPSYAARVDSVAAAYERNLRHAYAAETRWPDRPFWSRRHRSDLSAGVAKSVRRQ